MNRPTLYCGDEQRRRWVRKKGYNGLDYLEVKDERTLCVILLDKAPDGLKKESVRITGGRRIRDIEVERIRIIRAQAPDVDDCLEVRVNKTGDFSTYTLCLVALDEEGRPTDEPFPNFDPRYHCLDFTFKVDCPSDLDCKTEETCPPPAYDEPEFNYLAKDYASFRQLILDRLALLMPDWEERHAPDLGITLVEILAYAGDHLSYYQDAVATEAYLDTSRQRISVRRHARLVDYPMHEGCNARAWVHVHTTGDSALPPRDTAFITGHNEALPIEGRVLTWDDLREIPRSQYEVFEPLVANPDREIQLYDAHNRILFYTWGDEECCLPRGATSATLVDGEAVEWPPEGADDDGDGETYVQRKPPYETPPSLDEAIEANRILHLRAGDVLIFEETVGPKTGFKADADRSRRHAVRLTSAEKDVDPLTNRPVLEITWAEADALPFPLCISAIGPPPECKLIEKISVARGNVILVDHGRRHTEPDDGLWCVPTAETEITCLGQERSSDVTRRAGHFRPRLERGPLTHSEPYPAEKPATRATKQDPRQAAPWIRLMSQPDPDCRMDEAVIEPPLEEPKESPDGDDQPESPPVEQEPPADDGEDGPDDDGAATPEPPATWEARRDLLASRPTDRHFVAEIDNVGRAHLRFGDDELGRQPEAGASFSAIYRVGVGQVGNVGAEAISHVVSEEVISGVEWKLRNPLPAVGGVDPQPLEEVKLFAPHAFHHRLERAITAQDYADIVMRDFEGQVQRAAATFRWTGSWYEVLVAVDQLGRETADAELLLAIETHLRRYRRIGHDVVARSARLVPLEILLRICVAPDFLRGHVKAALLARFSTRALPDGSKGFFHPDNLSFGEGIYLSELVAVAQAVPGVESVTVEKLNRLFEGPNGEIEAGVLPLGPLEVAQVENDPSFPEHGRFQLIMEGGR